MLLLKIVIKKGENFIKTFITYVRYITDLDERSEF